jgi:hypothetical protein
MIDLVLQNADIPSDRLQGAQLAAFIEILYANGASTRDNRRESGQTEAAFVEFDPVVPPEPGF